MRAVRTLAPVAVYAARVERITRRHCGLNLLSQAAYEHRSKAPARFRPRGPVQIGVKGELNSRGVGLLGSAAQQFFVNGFQAVVYLLGQLIGPYSVRAPAPPRHLAPPWWL